MFIDLKDDRLNTKMARIAKIEKEIKEIQRLTNNAVQRKKKRMEKEFVDWRKEKRREMRGEIRKIRENVTYFLKEELGEILETLSFYLGVTLDRDDFNDAVSIADDYQRMYSRVNGDWIGTTLLLNCYWIFYYYLEKKQLIDDNVKLLEWIMKRMGYEETGIGRKKVKMYINSAIKFPLKDAYDWILGKGGLMVTSKEKERCNALMKMGREYTGNKVLMACAVLIVGTDGRVGKTDIIQFLENVSVNRVDVLVGRLRNMITI